MTLTIKRDGAKDQVFQVGPREYTDTVTINGMNLLAA